MLLLLFALVEFLACATVAIMALSAIVFSAWAGTPLSSVEIGAVFAVAIMFVSLGASKFGAGLLSVSGAVSSVIGWDARTNGSSFGEQIVTALVGVVVGLLGWFVGSGFVYLIADSVGANFALATTAVPDTSVDFFLQGLVQLVGLVHIDLFALLATFAAGPVWGIVARSTATGVFIAAFGPINGGGFNWHRSLAPGLIEGNLADTAIVWFTVAAVIAPFLSRGLFSLVQFFYCMYESESSERKSRRSSRSDRGRADDY